MRSGSARTACATAFRSIAQLDLVVLDDLGPARYFLAHEGIELVGRRGKHFDSLRRQLVGDLRCLDGLGKFVVDALDQGRGHIGATEYTPPGVDPAVGPS